MIKVHLSFILSMANEYTSRLNCRTCLTDLTDLKSIFGFIECVEWHQPKYDDVKDKEKVQICDAIRICVPEISVIHSLPRLEIKRQGNTFVGFSLQIDENDQLSKYICVTCLEKLCEIHTFRLRVLRTDAELRRIKNLGQLELSSGETSTVHESFDAPAESCSEQVRKPSKGTDEIAEKSKSHCNICDKYFVGSYRLEQHLMRKHTVRNDVNVLKPFECDVCDKAYTTSANLNIHKLTHSGTCR